MTLSRRSFSFGAAALTALVPAAAHALIENQAAVLSEVEAYLNGITTLDSRFVQLNQDGTVMNGTFQMKRPNFARIAYDDPETILIARGQKYMFWDGEIGQFYEGAVSASPASVLLYPDIDLDEVAKRAVVGAALHDRLVAALRRRRPDALAAAEADLARPTTLWGRLTAEPDLVATGVAPKRARVDDGANGGFAFGFG